MPWMQKPSLMVFVLYTTLIKVNATCTIMVHETQSRNLNTIWPFAQVYMAVDGSIGLWWSGRHGFEKNTWGCPFL